MVGTFSLCASRASAKETLVEAAPMQGKKVSIDGMLREWPKLEELSENISGRNGADDSAHGAAGYDAQNLYVAMKVSDKDFVRTGSFGQNEDHGALVIGFPRDGGGHKVYEVKLYPGEPGKSAGTVKMSGLGKVPGAKLVEMKNEDGVSFEASIPWSIFPEAKRVRSGLIGALRYHDADGGGKTTVVATSKSRDQNLPPLTIEAEYALHKALVRPKGLELRPNRSLIGNVVGDKMYEHVAIYDRYLAITGWNYRGGNEYYYQDLQLLSRGNLKRFSLEDIDQDGHDDIVIHRRVGSSGDARDYFEIWHFRASNDGPALLFQHEVGMVKGATHIENAVELKNNKGKWSVIVAQGSSDNLEPENWDGPTISGERATLMPWETVKSRRYEFDGPRFTLIEEQEWEPKMRAPAGQRTSSPGGAGDPLPGGDTVRRAPPPRSPNPDELLDKVYALYRTDRGVKKSEPRFDFVTDVAGNEETERVLIHDKDIVVFGKKFKQGTSYVYTSVGVKEPEHILDATASDVTGDGRAEVIVRAVIPVKASKQLGGDMVTRHALMIYQVNEDGISRIFGAETGRSLNDDSILGRVSFVPSGAAMKIELHKGRAVGWTEKTYPFPQDPLPYGGLEPLLLPWTDMQDRVYLYRGGEFKIVE